MGNTQVETESMSRVLHVAYAAGGFARSWDVFRPFRDARSR